MNIDNYINDLSKSINNLDKSLKKVVKQSALEGTGIIKQKTAVDKGILRNGWQTEFTGDYEATIFNNVEYAPHIEYGHRTRSGSMVPAQPMISSSEEEILDKFKERTTKVVNEVF